MTSVTKPMTVLVADDHALFRKGLVNLLRDRELCVVGEASDGRTAIELALHAVPDIVLMDVNMPGCSGIEATRIIHERLPETRILMLTVSEDAEDLFEAIKAGAMGYALKTIDPDELVDAIGRVMAGEAVIPQRLAAKFLSEFATMANSRTMPSERRSNVLTDREQEVLQQLSTGASNKEIANALSISEHTVKIHLKNILKKLHLSNRTQAAIYAQRQGLIPDRPTEGAR